MSYRVIGLPTGAFEAHNASHTQLADIAAGSFPHHDGTDYNEATPAVADTLTGGSPATLARAADVFNAAKALFHRHISRYTTGRRLLAHISLDSRAIAAADLTSGAALEAAMIAAWGPIVIELLTLLRNHMLNTGGTWHATADSFNSVGTIPSSISTKAEMAAWIIILYTVYEAHRQYGSGVQHTTLDTTNTVLAAPPDSSDDWDGMLGILVEVADELEDHVEDGAFHNAVMAVTPTVAAYPSGLFTLAIEFKSDWNGHLGDAAVHEVADATNTLSYTNPTTIALLITAAQEVYTDVPAHIAFAPKSAALRTGV